MYWRRERNFVHNLILFHIFVHMQMQRVEEMGGGM